ncbi:MAG TPA: GxxExxY protein [Bacteroidia bacterium]|nr:GxxExxY protein [Bacteroidia bacterium]
MNKKTVNEIVYRIIGAAIDVHKELGPGLLESVYHKCLKQEFINRGINFSSEFWVELKYKGIEIDTELRCDFLVEDIVVVELKAVDAIIPVHEAQLLTYLKLLNKPKGIMINFNCEHIFKSGQKTYVTELFRQLPDGY